MARSTDNAAEDELGGLYSVPPERFVAERNALARRLRDEGRREEAEHVAKLRRPTRADSAINRAVRAVPGKASGLVAAARELRHAHDRVMRGGGDSGLLKEATRQERSAISDVEQAALDILRAEGKDPSPDVQRRLRETLEAVTHDEDLLDRFAAGRLSTSTAPRLSALPRWCRRVESDTRLAASGEVVARRRARSPREPAGVRT